MNARFFFGFRVAGLILLATSVVDAQTILYVDQNAAGPTHDGSSWCSALTDLQDALDVASSGTTIRVADGTYTPDRGTGDREATFQLLNGVTLEGGYAGCGAPDPDARDIALYETVLSGDLGGNDDPGEFPDGPSFSENCYHVVNGSGTDRTAICDGFAISHGNADSDSDPNRTGGGMQIVAGSPTANNCTFTGNSASYHGGGLYNMGGNLALTGCSFTGNFASSGGGVYSDTTGTTGATLTLTDCSFNANSANHGGGMSTDMESSDAGSLTLERCTFTDNSSTGQRGGGGGLYANMWGNDAGSLSVTNCAFVGNNVSGQDGKGGGMYSNLTFTDGFSLTVTHCAFTGNSAEQGSGIFNKASASDAPALTLANCTFSDNACSGRTVFGGAVHSEMPGSEEASLTLTNCDFLDNCDGVGYGGGLRSWYTDNLSLANCRFVGNSTSGDGGGMLSYFGGTVRLTNCMFLGNSAGSRGGGMYSYYTENMSLTNCLFSGNSADNRGGGLFSFIDGNVSLTNCTFSGNATVGEHSYVGGLACNDYNSVSVNNCILWGNWDSDTEEEAAQIVLETTPAPEVNHTCIQGWTGRHGGIGNHGNDPRFADADGADGLPGTQDDDLHLLAGSPSIDAGDNTAVLADVDDLDDDGDATEPTSRDLDGKLRFVDHLATDDCPPPGVDCGTPPVVDMGAHEFQGACSDDADCDDGSDCTNEVCEAGECTRQNRPSGATCGDPSDTDCDNPDTCDTAGVCQDNAEPDGTPCADDNNECTEDFCEDKVCAHPGWPDDDPRACGACCFSTAGLCYDGQLEEECGGDVWAANDFCANRDFVCEKVIVPTLSEWGLVVLSLLLSIGIATKFARRRAPRA